MGLLLNQKTDIRTVVFDFKRLEYSYLRDHVLLITKEAEAIQAFNAINKHLDQRLTELESKGCQKIQDYLEQGYEMPFLVIVIDELAEMHDADCQIALNRILRLGRAAGICVVCATQCLVFVGVCLLVDLFTIPKQLRQSYEVAEQKVISNLTV